MAEAWGGSLWAAADLVTPMAVRVAATLRLADHIAFGERDPEALAAAVGADPDALRRVMAHLVGAGVLDAGFGLTALGEQLREDHPGGIRAWLDIEGAVGRAELSFVQLLHTVRTGEAAFPRQYGTGYWDDVNATAERSASFDALMGSRLAGDAGVVAAAYPWGDLDLVVDVGGGNGTLLIAILRAHSGLRGIVLDLPGPVARAAEAIVAAGLADRADARVGDLLEGPLPEGAGGCLLSGVLHDWPDEDATRILRRCADTGGKVLVIEDNLGEDGTPDSAGDLRMLCYVGGRDRTRDQMSTLAAAAGLTLGRATRAGGRTILEYQR
jgi:2,7-dihydroxy-5-methyl-1-naphthoate 7-O-methyltransferase